MSKFVNCPKCKHAFCSVMRECVDGTPRMSSLEAELAYKDAVVEATIEILESEGLPKFAETLRRKYNGL